jgi:hypothetical protein
MVEQGATDRVLIVAHTTTFLTELSLFGGLVRDRTDAEPVFYCCFAHRTAMDFAQKCRDSGFMCLLDPLAESLAASGLAAPALKAGADGGVPAIARLLARGAAALPGIGPGFVAEQLAFRTRASEIDGLLASVSPRVVVLGGDMPGYDTGLFVRQAHLAGIPVMVVPSTMSNGLEQAEVYYGDADYHVTGPARGLVATLFPKWVRQHKDKRLFRCPPGRILAMELAGIAPPEPWVFNSGYADAVAMESEAMIDYYAEAGMKHDRLILTGSLSDDAMASRLRHAGTLRRELCESIGFDPAKLLAVMGLPPDFLYVTGGRPQCDFQDYRELIRFWIDSLAELPGCNCAIALHPSMSADEFRWVERGNVRIAPWKTAELVPLCDFYVASISSTIRWAIACGKPVVNYDVYRYRYTDFVDVAGVLATEEQDEFRDLLRRLAGDEAFRRATGDAQRADAPRWGMLDGRVGDRMMEIVERLSGIAAKPAPAVRPDSATVH